MLYRLISTIGKLLLASLLAGVALSALNVTLEQILQDLGLTQALFPDSLPGGVNWAAPLVVLGSLVAVPIWLVTYALRPPKRN